VEEPKKAMHASEKSSEPNQNILGLAFILGSESKVNFQTRKNLFQSQEGKVGFLKIFLHSTLSKNLGHFVSEVS